MRISAELSLPFEQYLFFGDSSSGATKIFHAFDIPHKSRKFGIFHEIRLSRVITMWGMPQWRGRSPQERPYIEKQMRFFEFFP